MKQSRAISAICVLLMGILACMPGPAPANTAPPADTAAPAATAEPTQPAAEQYFTEEFNSDSGNWSQVVEKNGEEGDLSLVKVNVENGRLAFSLDKYLLAYRIYDPYEYTDVRVDAHVENRGTNVNDVLLICQASDEGFYLVNIANSGLFAMYAVEKASGTYTRIADGGSNKIKPGKEFNDYGLVCKGNKISLYVNGSKTRDYTDNRFAFRKGKVGVGIASEDQVPVSVEFDSVKISQP
jgi:hypothetical protein